MLKKLKDIGWEIYKEGKVEPSSAPPNGKKMKVFVRKKAVNENLINRIVSKNGVLGTIKRLVDKTKAEVEWQEGTTSVEELADLKILEQKKETVVAKGIARKEDAERLAREKKGVVAQDLDDPKKFMVVAKESSTKPKVKTILFGTVEELEKKLPDLQFVSNSQGVQSIKDYFGNLEELDEFDAFFIEAEEGEIVELYGIEGTVPYLDKMVWKIEITNPLVEQRSKKDLKKLSDRELLKEWEQYEEMIELGSFNAKDVIWREWIEQELVKRGYDVEELEKEFFAKRKVEEKRTRFLKITEAAYGVYDRKKMKFADVYFNSEDKVRSYIVNQLIPKAKDKKEEAKGRYKIVKIREQKETKGEEVYMSDETKITYDGEKFYLYKWNKKRKGWELDSELLPKEFCSMWKRWLNEKRK